MTVDVHSTLAALADGAASRLVAAGRTAIRERGRFMLSVSGGATPAPLYDRLADPGLAGALEWRAVHLFWSDERWLPHDHPDSNVRLVREHWLSRTRTPPGHIFPPHGGGPHPDAAAAEYAAVLRTAFGLGPLEPPVFDLHILGVGQDGHTASLFPGSAALDETERLVLAPWVPQLGAHRLTLTLPVFNRGREVWMLAGGAGKAAIVRRVLEQLDRPVAADTLPAARVRPTDGRLTWLLDEAAAAELPAELRER